MTMAADTPTRSGRIESFLAAGAGIFALAALLLCSCSEAEKESPKRVVFVSFDNLQGRSAFERFEVACRSIGIQARHGVAFEYVGILDGSAQGLAAGVGRVIDSHPLAVIAASSEILVEAARRTEYVPIVFATHEDPIELNITSSLAHQPPNLAGISYYIGIEPKMLETLRDAAPGARRIGYVVDSADMARPRVREFLEKTASRQGIAWKVVPVTSINTLAVDLRDAGPVDAWFITKVTALNDYRSRFVGLIASTGRPAVFPSRLDVQAGGAMAYSAEFEDAFGVLARQLDRVLSGVTPNAIPIERPKHFTLALNLRAARAAGLHLTPALISRADLVQ
jgi:putative ABC transport system substrate-binding protein